MFEQMTAGLHDVFEVCRDRRTLTETDLQGAAQDMRRAMLEADVSFTLVKDFVAAFMARASGPEVLQAPRPDQQVIKIVHELLAQMVRAPAHLDFAGASPAAIMLIGLQGSGKTTASTKLAYHLRQQGMSPLLVAADPYRPATHGQLVTLGRQLAIPVYAEPPTVRPPVICQQACEYAGAHGHDVVILDTAGRLHVDDMTLNEIEAIGAALPVQAVLLVVDAMTGHECIHVTGEFKARLPLSGLIVTRMDGDAKGGAVLSIHAMTGVPITFISTGEEMNAFGPFDPDRMARRILGESSLL